MAHALRDEKSWSEDQVPNPVRISDSDTPWATDVPSNLTSVHWRGSTGSPQGLHPQAPQYPPGSSPWLLAAWPDPAWSSLVYLGHFLTQEGTKCPKQVACAAKLFPATWKLHVSHPMAEQSQHPTHKKPQTPKTGFSLRDIQNTGMGCVAWPQAQLCIHSAPGNRQCHCSPTAAETAWSTVPRTASWAFINPACSGLAKHRVPPVTQSWDL